MPVIESSVVTAHSSPFYIRDYYPDDDGRPAGMSRQQYMLRYACNWEYGANILELYRGPSIDERGRLFGVELELAPRKNADPVAFREELHERFSAFPHFICKHDSSIPEGGSELVTVPMTLDEIGHFFGTGLDKLQTASAPDACGMHVHVNLAHPQRPKVEHLYQMLSFVYHTEMTDFIDLVARRSENTYCSREADHPELQRWAYEYCVRRSRPYGNDHHDAISFSRRLRTVEFRIFAATIDMRVVRANVEFVDALIEFSQSDAFAMSPVAFRDFVAEQPTRWPMLLWRLGLSRFRDLLEDWDRDISLAPYIMSGRREEAEEDTLSLTDLCNCPVCREARVVGTEVEAVVGALANELSSWRQATTRPGDRWPEDTEYAMAVDPATTPAEETPLDHRHPANRPNFATRWMLASMQLARVGVAAVIDNPGAVPSSPRIESMVITFESALTFDNVRFRIRARRYALRGLAERLIDLANATSEDTRLAIRAAMRRLLEDWSNEGYRVDHES